jgi:hypothetical protein
MRLGRSISHWEAKIVKVYAKWLVALWLAAVVALQAGVVAAASRVTYNVSGVETYATSTLGIFEGAAWANDDVGRWHASVNHTAFDSSGSATITGGSFNLDGWRRDVTGSFSGGSVSLTAADPGCGRQWYAVIGSLALNGHGSGAFNATLTHYRTPVFGYCVTYGATVRGTVTLSR